VLTLRSHRRCLASRRGPGQQRNETRLCPAGFPAAARGPEFMLLVKTPPPLRIQDPRNAPAILRQGEVTLSFRSCESALSLARPETRSRFTQNVN